MCCCIAQSERSHYTSRGVDMKAEIFQEDLGGRSDLRKTLFRNIMLARNENLIGESNRTEAVRADELKLFWFPLD